MEDRVRESPDSSGILRILTGHWLSVLGSSLVTIAGCSWLLLLTLTSGAAANPYLGILIFFAVPLFFFVGLALIPIGMYFSGRRIAAGLASVPDRRVMLRRVAL